MTKPHQVPGNFGPLRGANANARITGPCGDTMEFWLRIENDLVLQATFITDGCKASVASGSMAASMAEGQDLTSISRIAPEQISQALGGLPDDHKHCPVLALNTLAAAIGDYHARHMQTEGKPSPGGKGVPSNTGTAAASMPHAGQNRGKEATEDKGFAERLAKIRLKILVLSGKGGVGKSTVAANLATALAAAGRKTGLLDVDVHGPSIPKLLGLEGKSLAFDGTHLMPVVGPHGLKVVSLGFVLQNSRDAIIWRGPKKYQAIRELLGGVAWGGLDALVVDSPPGTGDEPLAIAQLVGRPACAIVVTTPQQVAVADVRRSLTFCQQVSLPVLGIIENMNGYVCPKCGETTNVFKTGGGRELALEMQVPLLGSIPIDPAIVESGDKGIPFSTDPSQGQSTKAFLPITQSIISRIQQL